MATKWRSGAERGASGTNPARGDPVTTGGPGYAVLSFNPFKAHHDGQADAYIFCSVGRQPWEKLDEAGRCSSRTGPMPRSTIQPQPAASMGA